MPETHRLFDLFRLPFRKGRILWTPDTGDGGLRSDLFLQSHLGAVLQRADGSTKQFDLGSGLVTNVGVTALANDFAWSTAMWTLKSMNWVATGTGTTAAAATDIALQTLAAPTTANAVSGTQSLVSAANSQTFKQSTTINYTSSLAITEWGLHSAQVLSASTGSPFTAGTATTGTVTGTPYTASSGTVQGEQLLIVKDTTNATPFYGLILSNSTSVLTVPAWYIVSSGLLSGSNPANADAFVILPVLWDHKVFAAINVNSGDSITFNYSLAVNSGG